MQFERNDMISADGTFRVRRDVVEISYQGMMRRRFRIEFFGDEEIEAIKKLEDALTGEVKQPWNMPQLPHGNALANED